MRLKCTIKMFDFKMVDSAEEGNVSENQAPLLKMSKKKNQTFVSRFCPSGSPFDVKR